MNARSKINKAILNLLSIFYFVAISACSTKEEVVVPAAPNPTILDLYFTTGTHLNPDIEGRASPLVIRFYQFKAVDKFNTSDFFALYDNDTVILGPDMVFRKELEIMPNSSRQMSLEINPDARYFAVFAAFRNLDTAQWKASMNIIPNKTTRVDIRLDEYNLSLKTGNSH